MLTAEQNRIMAEFIADENGGVADDYLDVASSTQEPLENFDGRNFVKWASRDTETREGFAALFFRDVQAAKGRPRVNLWVVDFGAVRGIYQL